MIFNILTWFLKDLLVPSIISLKPN